jgi:hypothetical protein
MYADVWCACDQCAHCALENVTKPCDRPFDVIFGDVWSPGAISSRNGDFKGLNVMEGMSSFVVGSPLTVVDSITMAQSMYQQFFTKFGLPRLLVADAGPEFRATLEAVAALLCINAMMLPPKSRRVQRCECFQRFLNKVVFIRSQDWNDIAE